MCAGCAAASLTMVSGTAGIADSQHRVARREKDAGLAQALLAEGLPAFVEAWYQQPMWQSLRAHPRYGVAWHLPACAAAIRSICTVEWLHASWEAATCDE